MLRKALTGLWATCVCLTMQAGTARAAEADIVLYASDAATLRGNWTRTSDATGAGGQMLSTPDIGWSTTSAPMAAPANYIEMTFTAPANTAYHVWFRLRATANSKYNDSVWVQYSDALSNGSPVYAIGSASALLVNVENCGGCGHSGWAWKDGAYWLSQASTIRFSSSGPHTLRVQTREDGVQIDQIVLSPATYLTQAPGQSMGDATMVAKPIVPTSTPYAGVPASLPGTVQAEDYDNGGEGLAYHDTTPGNSGGAYRQTNVDAEGATDGAYDVGWIAAGEWLAYSVNVAAAGNYLIETRVASNGAGGTFHVEFGGSNVTGALTIPNTGGWQNWTTVSKPVALTAGPQLMKLVFDSSATSGAAVGNVTWIRVTPIVPATPPTPPPGPVTLLPGTIKAVDFDNGGEGTGYHDTTAGNSGGQYRSTNVDIQSSSLGEYNVGWIADGEWLAYSVDVATAGTHTLKVQVASPYATGRIRVRLGAVETPAVAVPNTGGWQTWTTVTLKADLAAGPQMLKLFFDSGNINVAGVTVAYAGTTTPVPSPGPRPPIMVPAGGNLQAAIDGAQPGDTIMLEAGATFVGNFVLPVKTGSDYITIRSSAPDSALPGAGVRITPSHAALLPKLKSVDTTAVLRTAPGAHHYRLLFLEFLANRQGYGDIITLGDGSSAQNTLSMVPHDLIVDRVYIHGDVTYGQKRGIGLNSAATTILNSYISEIKALGQDSQAIASWNGPGPYTISNNYLEAAGENVIFGGSDPAIPNLIASDITFTRNHLSKQLAWRSQPGWNVKNLFELKNAQRVVVDGNLMENNWLAAQVGYAIVLTPRNQYGGAPWTVVRDVQFTNNIVRHVASGINILGHDYLHPSEETTNILIRNNLFEDVSGARYGGDGRFMLINGSVDITVDHNTVLQDGYSAVYATGYPTTRFVLTNNIIPDYSWVIMGADASPGQGTITKFFPNSQILRGIFVGSNPAIYPTGNYYPKTMAEVGFTDMAAGNYRLSPSSIYRGGATDGTDVGVNFDALTAAMR